MIITTMLTRSNDTKENHNNQSNTTNTNNDNNNDDDASRNYNTISNDHSNSNHINFQPIQWMD